MALTHAASHGQDTTTLVQAMRQAASSCSPQAGQPKQRGKIVQWLDTFRQQRRAALRVTNMPLTPHCRITAVRLCGALVLNNEMEAPRWIAEIPSPPEVLCG